MEEPLRPGVVVCGPPGTEPKPGFSRTRLDSNESLVYSRSSTAIASETSPFQKYVIPFKDMPKRMCQVDIYVPKKQLAVATRCTRSRTSMFRTKTRRESSESESECSVELTSGSDVTESEEEETGGRRKRRIERLRRRDRQRRKPRPPSPLKVGNFCLGFFYQNYMTLYNISTIICDPFCSSSREVSHPLLLILTAMRPYWSILWAGVHLWWGMLN